MIIVKHGNILSCCENIIALPVNNEAYLNSGLAIKIRLEIPKVFKGLDSYCNSLDYDAKKLLGKMYLQWTGNKGVAYLISQTVERDGMFINYRKFQQSLISLREYAIKSDFKIAMAYDFGHIYCHADWNIIYNIVGKVFNKYEVTLYREG